MKIQIPDALKSAVPATTWGKILAATPVVMTVLATMLAGLASSEMTRAQYDRSLAAQQQSKAGDQWGYFQAKRLRGTGLKTTGDVLQVTAEVGRFDAASLKSALANRPEELARCAESARKLRDAVTATGATVQALAGALDAFLQGVPRRTTEADKTAADLTAVLSADSATAALETLCSGSPPALPSGPALEANLKAALDAVDQGQTAAELAPLLAKVSLRDLDDALRAARDRARAFDTLIGPVNRLSDQLDALLARQSALAQESRTAARLASAFPADADPGLRRAAESSVAACLAVQSDAMQLHRDFTVARLRFAAARYDAEARLNQTIANLYELQVRKNNLSAERHHFRSQRFFYGMLAAQMAVIISTFAMAAQKRNLLWSLAAAAGAGAMLFAAYVFLYA